MTVQIRDIVLRVLGATLLLTLTAFPLQAHQVDPPAASSPVQAMSAVTATGTVTALIVDNQVSGSTSRYLALRLDEGQTVALTGAGLDSLSSGNRVAVTGNLTGTTLAVTSFSILPAAQVVARAGVPAQGNRQVQGTLVVFHKDYFAEGRGEFGLGVHDGATQMTPLNVAVIPDAVRAGMTVSVIGTTAADGVSLDVSQITILGLPPAETSNTGGAPITNNVLVLPIKFIDSSASDPFTPAQIDQVMRTNADSAAAYYNEVSYGQQQLNITVACATAPVASGCAAHTAAGGWLLSNSTTPASCDFTTIGNLADQAATAAGYNLANYKNRFYVMPTVSSCGWAGLAYIGSPYQAWSNGYNALWVYGHELGHNFTLWHAGSLDCGSQVLGGSCSASEYGDRFDIMGNNSGSGQQMHFNAAQKALLNWIPASSVKTHTTGTATYTLSPLETGGQAIYAVKIPVATDSNRTYWIEYRQPIGFDSGIAAYPNNGAQIRVASPFDYPCSGCGGDDTEILDMTPGSAGGAYDAALVAGQTYTDSAYGISVTVNSATAGALNLTVSVGGRIATTTTLTSSGSPSLVGANVTFTATVNGSAPTGTVAFTADGTTLSSCGTVVLPAGAANAKTATCSTTSLDAGTHSIVATYGSDAANAGSTSAPWSQVVTFGAPPSALVNPSFEIPALGNGYQYNPSVSGIGWAFSTNSGIQGNGSAFGAAAAPDGTQTAFVQSMATISQTLSLAAGSYTLSFKAAQRACCVSPYVEPIIVSVDGAQIGSLVSPSSTSFSSFSIPFSVSSTGAHTITFNGTDPNDKTTFIDAVTLTTAGVASTTTLASSGSPSLVGASVTFTATVTGSAPTGSVAFAADGIALSGCSALALPAGSANSKIATCSTASLAAGTHSIVATYAGDAANNGSTSPALSQVVSGSAASSTNLASSGSPSLVGTNVTFTATVTGSGPTGSVAFTADGTTLGGCSAVALPTGSANSKTATCNTTSLTAATHSIVANYTGDAANSRSTSATLSQQVVNGSTDVVWVEDGVPAGAAAASDGGDAWNWISTNPTPYSGALAHQSLLAGGEHQHYFYGATATLPVAVGDTLFAYVYLDPTDPPSEVMLQWNDGSWEHRAYWGANLIAWGTDGTVSRRYLGALPAFGQWMRLAVPAAQVGLEGSTLNGMAYTVYGGRATWDHAGKSSGGQLTPTATGLASSGNPSLVGASITFTATVTGSAPTGSVAFTADGTTLSGCGAVALPTGSANNKTATCNTASLAAGTHSIVATYAGDAANNGSTSTALSQTVSATAENNVALSSNGGIASASSTYSSAYPVSSINNNDRAGANGYWNDATSNTFPDWVQINFNGAKIIDHVVAYSVQDNYLNPVEPSDTMTFSLYGLVDFTVQGWDGANWVTLGTVTGNNLVKRTVSFAPYATDRIRINVTNALNSWSRVTEVEAWGTSAASTNVALTGNGGVASASSSYGSGYPASAVNNGERAGVNPGNGGYWNDATSNTFPDWVQINFNGAKTIDHAVVYSVQDNYTNPIEPSDTQTFSLYGVTDFTVQGWDGANWVTLATVSGNNLVKRTVTFSPYATDRIRVNITSALNSWSRLTEVEVWGN
jgi:Bacterial Ig-like domain (group 3)/F5/8 type C domain